jgi:tetratricopeptide (TPR) repeat protein
MKKKRTNLDILDFSQIFQGVSASRRTGTLRVMSGKNEKYIYFKAGSVVDLRNTLQETLLGTALLKTERITEKGLRRALNAREKTGGILGDIVVKQGMVDEPDIRSAIEFQISEEICDLFTWSGISCEFTPGKPPEIFDRREHNADVSINPESLVMEAARRIDEWELLRQTLPSVKDVYFATPKSEHYFTDHDAEKEKKVLGLVDGLNDVEEIAEKAAMSKFGTLKFLHRFASEGAIEPIGADDLYKRGVECASVGDFRKCVRLFERAEELGAEEFDLPNRLASVYDVLGMRDKAAEKYLAYGGRCVEADRLDDAVLAFQSILKHERNASHVRGALITVLIKQRRFEEVVRQTEMVVSVLLDEEKHDEAVEAWRRVIEVQPENSEPYRKLADLYQTMGESTQAIIELENLAAMYLAQKKPEKAIDVYREMLLLDPECVEARLGLAETLVTMDQKDKAYDEYQALSDMLSASGLITGASNSAFIINVYEKMAALRPADVPARKRLVDMYLEIDDKTRAVAHLKDIVQIKLGKDRPRDAVKHLRKIIELDPADIKTRLDLAEALLLAKNKDGAIDSLHELADYLIGKNHRSEARRIYEKTLEISPFDLKSMQGLAGLFGKRKFEEKFRMYRRISWCCRGAQLVDEGLTAARGALKIKPGDPGAMEDVIYFLLEKKDASEALAHMEKLARHHLDSDNLGAASDWAGRMLEIEKDHPGALKLMDDLDKKKARPEPRPVGPKIEQAPIRTFIKPVPPAPESELKPVIKGLGKKDESEKRKRKPTSVLSSMARLRALKGNNDAGSIQKTSDGNDATEPDPDAPAGGPDDSGNGDLPSKIDGTKKVKGVKLGGAASRLAALRKKKKE